MELEVSAQSRDKALNRRIAITVVVLSVFVGLCHIKDENTVQGMERSEAHAIDTWNEYQANKTKQHLAENARVQLAVLAPPGKAEAQERAYDTLRFRHDQFNAADAGVATAISLAAVAALMEAVALLWAAWGFGAFGIFMGLNAFLGGSFQLGILSSLLG